MLEVEDKILQFGVTEVDVDLKSEISDWIARVRVHDDVENTLRQVAELESETEEDLLPAQADVFLKPRDEDVTVGNIEEPEHDEQADGDATGSEMSDAATVKNDLQTSGIQRLSSSRDLATGLIPVVEIYECYTEFTDMYAETRSGTMITRHSTNGPRTQLSFALIVYIDISSEESRRGVLKNVRLRKVAQKSPRMVEVPFKLELAPGTLDGYRIRCIGLGYEWATNKPDVIFEIVSVECFTTL